MKSKIAVLAALASCTVFAGEYGPVRSAEEFVVREDVSSPYLLVAETTTTTTTVTTRTLYDGSVQVIEEKVTTISPEDGGYTYVVYEDAYVPYFMGYCYINGIWIWRGHGIAPFPPPNFHPRPHPHRPHHPHHHGKPAKKTPAKPPVKPAPAAPRPAAKPAPKPAPKPAAKPAPGPAPRGGGHAPAGGRR